MNVLLVGEDAAGVQTLRAIASSGYRVVAVMSSPTKKNSGASLWNVAERLGYPTWSAKLVKDPNFAEKVCAEQVDIILNVYSLFIINNEVLTAPRIGSFNMHPGPLPRYAGLNSVSWALYRGESTYGVTIHKMVPEIDAGPIAYQAVFQIEATDTALSLTSKCVKAGVLLVLRLLETASVNPDAIPLVSQDLTRREYFGKDIPANGRLSWSRPAHEIVNFVRACDYFPFRSPWGHPRTKMCDQVIGMAKASLTGSACDALPGTVGRSEDAGVYVACADEWILIRQLLFHEQYLNPTELLKAGERLRDGL